MTAKPVGRSRACPASLRVRKGKVKHCMPDERSSRKTPLGTASRMQILSASEMPKRRKHYGCAAIMRFLSASESPETQKILRMRSDNANLECKRKRRNTENTTDPQRECEFAIFAKSPKTEKHYGIAMKIRISSPCKASQSQKTLWDRSENTNFLSSQSRPKPKNIMGSQ